MKTRTSIVLVAMSIFCLGLPRQSDAAMIFDDGGIHNIDRTIPDNVVVYNSVSDQPTTVNFLDGGELSEYYTGLHVHAVRGSGFNSCNRAFVELLLGFQG